MASAGTRGRSRSRYSPNCCQACSSFSCSIGHSCPKLIICRTSSQVSPPITTTISPENLLKWERVHPKPEVYNFGPADKYVNLGEPG